MCRKSNRITPVQAGLLLATACVLWTATAVQADLPDGLVAYYRFNSTSGLTAVDETGAHNGTLTGSLSWVEGVEGNAGRSSGRAGGGTRQPPPASRRRHL